MIRNWLGLVPILFFTLTVSTTAFADREALITESPDLEAATANCDTVDYRKTLAPNRFQGETSFCFAYSSATLLHQRTGIDVSPLDLATTFYFTHADALAANPHPEIQKYLTENPEWRRDIEAVRADADIDPSTATTGERVQRPNFPFIGGGVEDVTVLLANAKGYCLDQDFPSHEGLIAHQQKIDELILLAETSTDRSTPPEMVGVHQKYRDPVADIFNAAWLRYLEKSCRRVKPKVPILPVNFAVAKCFEDYAKKVASGALNPQREAKRLFNVIDFALNHSRSPAVGYSLFTFSPREANDPDLFADHSSAVVARKRLKNQCYYLVRDASGLLCGDYYPTYQKRCRNSEFWVTREELSKSLYSVVYLR